MPAWLSFRYYATLKRMRQGDMEVLNFHSESAEQVTIYTNRLRSLLNHWDPPHHWSVRRRGAQIIVTKLHPWR